MKITSKLMMALCLALIACLAAPALLPAGMNAPFTGYAAAALNKTKATVYNGKTLKLKVTGTSRTVRWSSSNTAVATVDKTGLVKAKKVGKAVITAKVGGNQLTCRVTVKSPLSADATKLNLEPGATKYVTLTYKLNGKLSLKKYDSSVLNCSLGKLSKGKCTLTIKTLRPGKQTLTVKNSKTSDVVKIVINVREVKPVDPIVDKTEVTVAVGKTATVHVTWPYAGVPHMWYNDSSVATAEFGDWDKDGWPLYIKGVGKGTALVWLTKGEDASEDVMAEIKVTVK